MKLTARLMQRRKHKQSLYGNLTVAYLLELDCVEFGLLQELIDECVDRTAREESNAYLTHSPHYEYWCSKHACAVELRNGFMKALSHARPKRNKERDL